MVSGAAMFHNIEHDSLMDVSIAALEVGWIYSESTNNISIIFAYFRQEKMHQPIFGKSHMI